jgi:hypothetical protein
VRSRGGAGLRAQSLLKRLSSGVEESANFQLQRAAVSNPPSLPPSRPPISLPSRLVLPTPTAAAARSEASARGRCGRERRAEGAGRGQVTALGVLLESHEQSAEMFVAMKVRALVAPCGEGGWARARLVQCSRVNGETLTFGTALTFGVAGAAGHRCAGPRGRVTVLPSQGATPLSPPLPLL